MKKIILSLALALVTSSLSAKELAWQLPDAWKVSAQNSAMRIATFQVKADEALEILVTRFPGAVGGELANVNRWRMQIGLEAIQAEDLQKGLELIDSKVGQAKLLDISNGEKQLLAVMLPYEENTYFFKLIGNKNAVSKEKENLVKLVKSLTVK
jgi:hypothetical protein